MTVSRTEVLAGAGLLVLAGGAVVAWTRSRPRYEALAQGGTQAVGVWTARGGVRPPAGFENYAGGSDANPPARLLVRLPPSARGIMAQSVYESPRPDPPLARAILPDGSDQRLDLRRDNSMGDEAAVEIPRDLPPDLPYVDVEVRAPRAKPSRWRLFNLPLGTYAFDPAKARNEQGTGARRFVGRAGRVAARWPGTVAGVYVAVVAPQFGLGKDEAADMKVALDSPFAPPGAKADDDSGLTTSYDGSRAFAMTQPVRYLSYTKAVRVRGRLRRYRVFDEWADFGEVPLRPRPKAFAGYSGPVWNDVEPALKAPRVAATPSGLRLVLQPRTIQDNSGFGGSDQSLTFHVTVDEATRRRGLPAGFPTGEMTVGVDRVGGKDALFTSLDHLPTDVPQNAVWGFFRKAQGRSVRLRLAVRRAVLLEEAPFDLRLPISERIATRNAPSPGGTTFLEADPKTLLPRY